MSKNTYKVLISRINRTKLLTFKIISFMHLWMLRFFCHAWPVHELIIQRYTFRNFKQKRQMPLSWTAYHNNIINLVAHVQVHVDHCHIFFKPFGRDFYTIFLCFFLFFLSNSEILNLVKLTWFPVWTKYRCCPCQMFWSIPHIQRHYPWSLCRLPCSRWIPVYLCRHLEKK